MFSVAVIGLGMGQAHLSGYSAIADLRIEAIADLDEARLHTCAEKYRVPMPIPGTRTCWPSRESTL